MKRFLVSGFADFGIEVETGISNVELHGKNISGKWLATPKVIRNGASRPIAVELLNSLRGVEPGALPEVALEFTKKFGPLTIPYRAASAFSFTVDGWWLAIHRLRYAWAAISHSSQKKAPVDIPLDRGECFRFANG